MDDEFDLECAYNDNNNTRTFGMKNRNTIGVVFAQINNETVGPCPERQSKV
jgi:hypothetical protein